MSRLVPNAISGESTRFFLISLVGLGIDIGVAWALIVSVGVSDPVAALVGFSVATTMNYVGHQFWTFQKAERRASWRRFLAFSSVVVFTLIVRLLVLDLLGPLFPGDGPHPPLRLGLAASVSFFVSFVMSRFLVFRHKVNSHV